MEFTEFRSTALQSLAVAAAVNGKVYRKIKSWSKDKLEAWVKSEYERHYGKG